MSISEMESTLLPKESKALYSYLKDGMCVKDAAAEVGLKYSKALRLAKILGYDRSWRNLEKYPDTNARNTKTNKEMLRLYNTGLSMAAVGRIVGLSRERVRQLLKRMGATPGRKRAATQSARKKAEAQALKAIEKAKKETDFLARWKPCRVAWEKGLPIAEIAKLMNKSLGVVGQHIVRERKSRGWYPYRNEAAAKYHVERARSTK